MITKKDIKKEIFYTKIKSKKDYLNTIEKINLLSIKDIKSLIISLLNNKIIGRKEILERDGKKCRLCGREEYLEVHHITPKIIGGEETEENMITLCQYCHGFMHCNPMTKYGRGELIKESMIKKEGKQVISKYGKRWGRKPLKVERSIIALHKQGKTIRDICKEVYYWDKNNHKKFVSLGYVHKTLLNYKKQK